MNTKLKEIRENEGLTQVQIAKEVGISERGYQNYERGIRIPNVYVAQMIAKIFKKQVEEVFPLSEYSIRKSND